MLVQYFHIFSQIFQRHVCLSVSHSIFIVTLIIILHTHPFIVCHFLCLSPYKNRFINPSQTLRQTTSKACADWMANSILMYYTPEEKKQFYFSCSLCGMSENPLTLDNHITTSSERCNCDVNAPFFTELAPKRSSRFLQIASKYNSVNFAIRNSEGRKTDKLLLHNSKPAHKG